MLAATSDTGGLEDLELKIVACTGRGDQVVASAMQMIHKWQIVGRTDWDPQVVRSKQQNCYSFL